MILQNNMTVNLRNDEERRVFCEIGDREGLKWAFCAGKLSARRENYDAVYINIDRKVLTAPYNYQENSTTKIVEAADLFCNYIISRRVKNGNGTK